MRVVPPPGGYGYDPVYLRVNTGLAGPRWPCPGYDKEWNDREMRADPEHDYVQVDNGRIAFWECGELEKRGIPPEALAVVRKERKERRA